MLTIRNTARANVGYPRNTKVRFDVRMAQGIIGTYVDGAWGPKSQKALRTWVADFQRILKLETDGQWGPKTDNAFLILRKTNHKS
jgi:hypothetical protein